MSWANNKAISRCHLWYLLLLIQSQWNASFMGISLVVACRCIVVEDRSSHIKKFVYSLDVPNSKTASYPVSEDFVLNPPPP